MNILIRSNKLYPALKAMEKAYETGDFSEFVTFLAPDCTYQSMWVLETLTGCDAVSSHLLGKGESIKRTGAYPECSITEIISVKEIEDNSSDIIKNQISRITEELEIEPLLFCLKAVQTVDEKENKLLIFLKLNEANKVQSIGLLDASRYETTYTFPCVDFVPGNGEEETEEMEIYISEHFVPELYLFFGMTDFDFDEYDDLSIPMDVWQKMLEFWNKFNTAEDFDCIFEELSGFDYSDWSFKNHYVYERLGQSGLRFWQSRKKNDSLVKALLEWTDMIKETHNCVRTYGI